MSMVLRHAPEKAGISLSSEGWCEVGVFLDAMQKKFPSTTKEDIESVVASDNKGRFQILDARIRATQGHSVEGVVAVSLTPVKPPPTLYHGTTEERWVAISVHGSLIPMARHHVHLSEDRETAKAVGERHRRDPHHLGSTARALILSIDATRMVADGYEFYRSENGVWMTDRVPTEYVTIED